MSCPRNRRDIVDGHKNQDTYWVVKNLEESRVIAPAVVIGVADFGFQILFCQLIAKKTFQAMHNGILISAQSNYMEVPDGFPFCQRFPAASCCTQVAHLTLWGVFSFAPAPKRVSILSMLPTSERVMLVPIFYFIKNQSPAPLFLLFRKKARLRFPSKNILSFGFSP